MSSQMKENEFLIKFIIYNFLVEVIHWELLINSLVSYFLCTLYLYVYKHTSVWSWSHHADKLIGLSRSTRYIMPMICGMYTLQNVHRTLLQFSAIRLSCLPCPIFIISIEGASELIKWFDVDKYNTIIG